MPAVRDIPAANAIAATNADLAPFLARKLGRLPLGRPVPWEDRVSYAGEAVVRASRYYDPIRGSLSAYAERCLRNLLCDWHRVRYYQRRAGSASEIPLDDAPYSAGVGADPGPAAVDAAEAVAYVMARLPDAERNALTRRYFGHPAMQTRTGLQKAKRHRLIASALKHCRELLA